MSFDDPIHTFVVPAFGDSPHLEECLRSLAAQHDASPIIVSTSTPSKYLESLATSFNVKYYVHDQKKGIGHDWNMAMMAAGSDWITIAHQDDIYYPEFAGEVKKVIALHSDASVIFTNYHEIRNGRTPLQGSLIALKKLLLQIGFLGRRSIQSKLSKTNTIRFGCAIPCPTVTLPYDPSFKFHETLQVNLDWDAWLRKAQSDGSFVWIGKTLMAHRIHEEQASSSAIRTGIRHQEDLLLLQRLWPSFVANLIEKTYRLTR